MSSRGYRFGNSPVPLSLLLGGGVLLLVVIVVIVSMSGKNKSKVNDNISDKKSPDHPHKHHKPSPPHPRKHHKPKHHKPAPSQKPVSRPPPTVDNSISTFGCSTNQTTLNNSKLSKYKSTRNNFVKKNCPTDCAAIITGSLCQRNGQTANASLENGRFVSI
jgi:hypothetical protein